MVGHTDLWTELFDRSATVAAAGYVVFYTNPRGSTSYGEKFANEIDLAYPGYDYDDDIRCGCTQRQGLC